MANQQFTSLPRKAIAYGNYDTAITTPASGGVTVVEIKPPVGELWRFKLVTLILNPPAGATTGEQEVVIRLAENNWQNTVAVLRNGYDTQFGISYNRFTASALKVPSSEAAQIDAIQGLVATHDSPLYIAYVNATDALQSNTLTLRIVREVEYIDR